MGFFDWLMTPNSKIKGHDQWRKEVDKAEKKYGHLIHAATGLEPGNQTFGSNMYAKERQEEVNKKTKKNSVKPFFNPKDYKKGLDILKGKNKISSLFNDKEKNFLDDSNLSTEAQADVYVKSKLLWNIANDVMNTTTLTDEEKKEIEKEYGKNEKAFTPISKEEFKNRRYKNKTVSLSTLDKEYNAYLNTMNARKKIYGGNALLALTAEYNEEAKETMKYALQVMSLMLEGKIPADDKTVLAILLQLNDRYNSLILNGQNEADAYNYPLQVDEVVAHSRIKSNIRGKSWLQKMFIPSVSQEEVTDRTGKNGELSMYTFVLNNMTELQKNDVDEYKNSKGYNADLEISDMLNVASDNLFLGTSTENGQSKFLFKDVNDNADDLMGLKGFNNWRKEGYLDDILNDKAALEELAVTYKVIKSKQGEEAANQWLQERFLHYASEGISGWDLAWNSSAGFLKDLAGDATEIVGGVWGIASGTAQGIWNTFASDDSIDLVWTDAIGQAFDNRITRWGSDLSSTGYFDWEKQNKAKELGFSIDDNIMDPEKANEFLLKGGGSGWGYFLGETGRQASHTMFAVWSGKLLMTPLGKAGAWIGGMLRGTKSAMKVGYRIGSTTGLMISGSNEGIMDGIQVKEDIYKLGIQAVEREIEDRAIFDAISSSVNIDDDVALALFLLSNHVGDLQVQDPSGKMTTVNNLIYRDEKGQLKTALNRKQMIDLLKNSEYGQLIIEQYKGREDVAAEYEEMKRQANNSAIRNGAATAVIENYINGSIRGHNAGVRANIRGAERAFKKRLAATTITRQGEVNIKDVGIGFALKQSGSNALHEAIEEGSQTITQLTFTSVGNNSIKRYIDNAYDTDTWNGFFKEYSAVVGDVIQNAGLAFENQEVYEAAILGAIGSLMGFGNFKKGKGTNWHNKIKFSWDGSIFNVRQAIQEENTARKEMAEALLNSINSEGGVNTLLSMTSTSNAIGIYNDAVDKSPESLYENNEKAVDALMHNVSTLVYARNTEFGRMINAHLTYQSLMLGDDFTNSEMSQDDITRMRRERAREFLTAEVEGEELSARKLAALKEVLEWLKKTGGKVRSIEEMLSDPTDAEADALIDIVMTAKQTTELVDKMTKIDAENSRNVLGLNFVAKNELNVKTLLLLNQEERLKEANDRLTRIAELRSPESNTTLNMGLKQSIAILGNSDTLRENSKKQYEKDKADAELNLKKIKANLKEVRRQIRSATVLKNGQLAMRYRREELALEDQEAAAKQIIKVFKDRLTKDKRSIWDVLTGGKETSQIAEGQRVLTAYDILTLTPHERAIMLDPNNKDKYSPDQLTEISKARGILVYGNATDLIQQTNVLQTEVNTNSEEINNVLTNIGAYNKHVENAELKFRLSVLDYRYQNDVEREMNRDEVWEFMDKLDLDVEQGLLSSTERSQLINRAIENENQRNKDVKEGAEVKDGWSKYNQIIKQHLEIGSTLVNNNVAVDKTKFDNLMDFLRENRMTLQEFNQLTLQDKEQYLRTTKVDGIENTPTEISSYIEFAAGLLHSYEEAKIKGANINQDIARGNNNGGTAEESVVQEQEDEPTTEEIKNSELLLKRISVDHTGIFGSRLNRIISYLRNPEILNDEVYKNTVPLLLDAVISVAQSDIQITSVKQFYQMIDEAITDANVRNTWFEVLNVMRIKELTRESARKSKTFRDRTLGNTDPASSANVETQRVSLMRMDESKKPLIDFLDEYSYDKAAKMASQMSQGSTGLGMMIYYVTDPRTTQRYRSTLGEDYSDSNNLPIFTCVKVGNNWTGKSIPITVGNETINVVPIGVLNDNVELTKNERGILWTQAIRDVATLLINNTMDPVAVTVSGMPVTSSPLNWGNWVRQLSAEAHTGRRSILLEVAGFGEQVKSSINSIINKLTVRDVGNKKNLIVYDNGMPEGRLPIVRSAGLSELRDNTKEAPIVNILGGDLAELDWEINNPIINMFYNSILKAKGNLSELIGSRDNLLRLLDEKKIGALNGKINDLLSKSFWIGSYNGEKQWKYEIDVQALIDGKFILRAVPEGSDLIEDDQKENLRNSKQVVLLDFTQLFDETGLLQLNTVHANVILLNLLFDSNWEERTRHPYGTSFAQILIGHGLIKHANGVFSQEETDNLSPEDKKEKQERAHSVLSSLVEGGGLLVEGLIDLTTDYLVVQRPVIFDENRNVVLGELLTAALTAAMLKLRGYEANPELDNATADLQAQSIGRDRYIGINDFKNQREKEGEQGQQGELTKTRMWATTLSNWLTGMFWEKRKETTGGTTEQRRNKEITLGVGNNADLIFRHVLWTSKYNINASEKEGLKKIPKDDTESGEGFYTNKELEEQFGFHASHVKALAYAFDSYLTLLQRERGYTFVTNVIKPKTKIEITDKDTGKKYKVPIAGELDMLAIDQKGMLHPIDFKTVGFQNKSNLLLIRSNDVDTRVEAIKNRLRLDFDKYSRQLNIYLVALEHMGFEGMVGDAFVLAIPVAYSDDPSAERKVRPNSEYNNSVLMTKDANGKEVPYLEGLELFEAALDGTDPAKLTELKVEYDKNFQFSMQDIIYLAQSDINFLRKNPEFAEAINDLRALNANKSSIEIKLAEDNTTRTEDLISEANNGRLTFRRRKKKHKQDEVENTEQSKLVEAENLAIGKTQANFNEISRRIQQMEAEPIHDEEIDTIEFIVNGESITYTVKQVKDVMADYTEEEFNNMTVKEVCDKLNCKA